MRVRIATGENKSLFRAVVLCRVERVVFRVRVFSRAPLGAPYATYAPAPGGVASAAAMAVAGDASVTSASAVPVAAKLRCRATETRRGSGVLQRCRACTVDAMINSSAIRAATSIVGAFDPYSVAPITLKI